MKKENVREERSGKAIKLLSITERKQRVSIVVDIEKRLGKFDLKVSLKAGDEVLTPVSHAKKICLPLTQERPEPSFLRSAETSLAPFRHKDHFGAPPWKTCCLSTEGRFCCENGMLLMWKSAGVSTVLEATVFSARRAAGNTSFFGSNLLPPLAEFDDLRGLFFQTNIDTTAVFVGENRAQSNAQAELIVVWDESALYGVTDCLPSFIILIKDTCKYFVIFIIKFLSCTLLQP